MTNIYDFKSDTGEYLGERLARESPKEPGVYLVPANATTAAPPAALADHARVWDGSQWTQEADNRGVRFWTPEGGLQTQEALGALPGGANVVSGADPSLNLVSGLWTDAPVYPTRAEIKLSLDAALESKMNALSQSQPGPWKAHQLFKRTTEAEEADAVGNPQPQNYPVLAALLGSSYGDTIGDVATAILAEQATMEAALLALDTVVVQAKEAIDAAADDAAANAIFETAMTSLA